MGKDDGVVCGVWCLIVHKSAQHCAGCGVALDRPGWWGVGEEGRKDGTGIKCSGTLQHDIVLKV